MHSFFLLRRAALRRRWALIFITFGVIAYTAIGVYVSALFPKSSDQTAYFQAGLAMAHGHWRLGGWLLTSSDFWTSDIPLSAILSIAWRLLGRPEESPFLLMLQPVLMWAAVVGSALYLVIKSGGRIAGILVIMALMAVPLFETTPAYFITLSAIHIGTVCYALWALHFAAERRWWPCAITLCLGTIGDPLMLVAAGLPITLWGVTRDAKAFCVALAASLCAELLLTLNTATGGFRTEMLPMRFGDFPALGHRISVTTQDLLIVFGADPTGRPVREVLTELLRLAVLALGAAALWRIVRHRATARPFIVLLALCCATNVIALLVSDRIDRESNPLACTRYLFPLWAALSILAALEAKRVRGASYLAGAALVASLVTNIRTLPAHSTGILTSDDQHLVASLEKQAPANGIGSWWNSRAFDAAAMGRLHIVPALSLPGGGLTPFQHISTAVTFPSRPFFVLLPTPTQTFERKDVIKTFGLPDSELQIGRTRVLIYQAAKAG